MPQMTTITLADATSPTPVDHAFEPVGPDKNHVFYLADRSAASAIGFWKISISVKDPAPAAAGSSSQDRVSTVEIGLHEPVLENVSNSTISGIEPAPTISYVPRYNLSCKLPERASAISLKHIRKMFMNLLANSQIVSILEDRQHPY